jgi:hypothetical protein
MTKATILGARDAARLPDVPQDSPLVLDFGASGFDAALVAAMEAQGHRVTRLVARAATLDDAALDALARQPIAALARIDAMPDLATVLRRAKALAHAHLVLELPVPSEDEVAIVKVLSSLGVRTGLDVRQLFVGGELMLELLTDAMMRPGRRTPPSPISDIEAGFDDEDFELERLDLRANDHHVDLRDGAEVDPEAWSGVDVARKRERFLVTRHPCAFCEGLTFCHGYLYAEETADACRSFASELMELRELDRRRAAAAPSGREKARSCGC